MKTTTKLVCLLFVFLAADALPQSQEEINELHQKSQEIRKASLAFLASPKSINMMKEAAESGDAGSQWSLATQYESGQGIPQNYIKAYIWYSVSAAQGGLFVDVASSARDAIGAKMAPSDLLNAQALAEKCFESNYKDCD